MTKIVYDVDSLVFLNKTLTADEAYEIERRASLGDTLSEYKLGLLLLTGTGFKEDKEAAFKLLEKAAIKEQPSAAFFYAQFLFNGFCCNPDYKKAAGFYEISAMSGIPEAQYVFAKLLSDGKIIPSNPKRASRYFKAAADGGIIPAQVEYASTCLKYEPPTRDYQSAAKYYKLGAEKGNPEALYGYGFCLKNGLGVTKNLQVAKEILLKAAEKQHLGAIVLLGEISDEEGDSKTALSYYKKAAEQSYPPALYKYGMHIKNGQGCGKDVRTGAKYIEQAAFEDYEPAMYEIGRMLVKTSSRKDDGVKYLKKAADSGYMDAQFYYGNLLKKGKYVEKDPKQAAIYFKNAADNGYAKAMYSYAFLLKSGDCGKANPAEVVRYYQMASEKGIAKAQFNLAKMYQEGDLVPQDSPTAMSLVQRAALGGLPEAMYAVGCRLLENPREETAVGEDGVTLITRAADGGYGRAQLKLAQMLEHGLIPGADDSPEHLFALYNGAAKQGLPDAMYKAGSMLYVGNGTKKNAALAAEYLLKAAEEKFIIEE